MKKNIYIIIVLLIVGLLATQAEAFATQPPKGGYKTVSYKYPVWLDENTLAYVKVEHYVKYVNSPFTAEEPYLWKSYIMKKDLRTDVESEILYVENSDIKELSYDKVNKRIYFGARDQINKKNLVYYSDPPSGFDVHVLALDTNKLEIACKNGYSPYVSPDGSMVLFYKKYSDEYVNGDRKAKHYTKNRWNILNTDDRTVYPCKQFSGAKWHPMKNTLVLGKAVKGDRNSYEYDPVNMTERLLYEGLDQIAAFSPDGSLAISLGYLVNLETFEKVKLPKYFGEHISIAPDLSCFAYDSKDTNTYEFTNIYICDTKEQSIRVLLQGAKVIKKEV